MDEKTEQLREIFVDIAEEETVTESQRAERGSLLSDDRSVDERLTGTIEQMAQEYGFDTSLSTDQRCRLVRGFYTGEDDESVAEALGCSSEVVFRARMELHLVRDTDRNEPLEERVRDSRGTPAAEGESRLPGDVETELGEAFGREQLDRVLAVLGALERSRRSSHRYRAAFEAALTDEELTDRLSTDTLDDGLEDATDGAEVDVEF